jgi:hypothetical protein
MSRAVEELYEQASHLSEEDRAKILPMKVSRKLGRRKSNEEWSSTERAGSKPFRGRKFALTCIGPIGNASRVLR